MILFPVIREIGPAPFIKDTHQPINHTQPMWSLHQNFEASHTSRWQDQGSWIVFVAERREKSLGECKILKLKFVLEVSYLGRLNTGLLVLWFGMDIISKPKK